MAIAVPQLYQPHTLPHAMDESNALVQHLMQTQAMPEQIRNSLSLGRGQAQIANNEAQYGSGQFGAILTALNNPNTTPEQKNSLNAALTISSLYRPGMPSNPTSDAIRTGVISKDPELSGTVQAGSGQTPQELYDQQNKQYQSKTQQQEARAEEARQRGSYYQKGGAKGAYIDYLMNNAGANGALDPAMLAQAVGTTLTMGAPPAVKAQAAIEIANKYGNTALAESLDKWQQKGGTNAAIQNKLSGYAMIDKGFENVMPQYLPIMQYYSGPEGVAKLKTDQLAAASGLPHSKEFDKYKEFTTTILPTLADQLRKTWGNSITPEMNSQLQGIIGFKNDWDQLQQNPEIVMNRYNSLRGLLANEVSALQGFQAPSLTGNKQGLEGYENGGKGSSTSTTTKVRKFNPATGKIE